MLHFQTHVFLAFYNEGDFKIKVNSEDLFKSFKKFYDNDSYAYDIKGINNLKGYKTFDINEYKKSSIYKEPLKHLSNTSKEFFYKEDEYFCLNNKLESFIKNEFFVKNFIDVVELRSRRFLKERLEKNSFEG